MGLRNSVHMSKKAMQALEESQRIDEALDDAARQERSKVKLLLLGAAESGKSTIFRQFQLLYGNGYHIEERSRFKGPVHSMVLQGMRTLVEHAEIFGLDAGFSAAEKEAAAAMAESWSARAVTPTHAAHINTLWPSAPIQQTLARRAEFQFIDGNRLFMSEVDRIADANYVPTVDDILNLRIRTSGITEQEYTIDNVRFHVVDVGGQRNERKKWIHCFDNVTAVIFVAALSEFNQVLFEDPGQNRMVEAITLFEEICETRFFTAKPMILFLNKSDLLREKLEHTSIADEPVFDDYPGRPGNFDDAVSYFLEKFEERNHHQDRKIYSHVTCATDSDNVEFVFQSARDIILATYLADLDFL